MKKYKKLVDFYSGDLFTKRYERELKGNWKKISYRYINALLDFKYNGWWTYDLLDKGMFKFYEENVLNKILRKTIWRNEPERSLNCLKNEVTYCSHPSEQKFLTLTRKYIDSLFESVSGNKEIAMVDQLVPPSNSQSFVRYFNNLKVVVVDRDPRDLFLLEKYVWKSGVIPHDVKDFCKWFDYTREGRVDRNNTFNGKYCYIQFEDMIYNYESTSLFLTDWLGLNETLHFRKKQIFNPAVSINNTHLWSKISCNSTDIEYIENHLSRYLYNYSK